MFNSGLGFSVVWKSICEEKKFFQLSIWAMIFYFDHWGMLSRARLSSVSDWRVQNQEITRLHKNISGSEAFSLQILFNFWDFDTDPAQSWCQGWVKIAKTKLSSTFDIFPYWTKPSYEQERELYAAAVQVQPIAGHFCNRLFGNTWITRVWNLFRQKNNSEQRF